MQSVARSRILCSALLVSVFVLCGGIASAGTVDIFSNLTNESNNITGTDVAIPVTPAWAPSGAGYEWISYGQTGCNTFVPLTGLCTPGAQNPAGVVGVITGSGAVAPTAIFYKTFTILDAFDSGNLQIWADDTARVCLYTGTVTTSPNFCGDGGQLLFEANPNAGSNCAAGAIGCLPGTDAVIPLGLTTGTYTLVIDAYQFVGGSPFGVMYAGVLTDTPEPASFMLLGFGLVGLGVFARRRRS